MTVLIEGAGDTLADAGRLDIRLRWTLLTDPSADHTWRLVSGRVVADLIRRGCQPADALDLCQQAGLRALEREIRYTTPDELVAWCLTVSRRLLVDDYRRRERRRRLSVVSEEFGDVKEEAMSSLRVQDLVTAFGKLPERDREALLSTRAPVDRQDSNRMAVQRFRARARLLKLLAGIITAAWVGVARLPRLASPLAAVGAGYLAVASLLLTPPAHSPAPPRADGHLGPRVSEPFRNIHRLGATAGVRVVPLRARARAAGTSAKPACGQVPHVSRTEMQQQEAPRGVCVKQRPAEENDRLVCADHLPVIAGACTPLLEAPE